MRLLSLDLWSGEGKGTSPNPLLTEGSYMALQAILNQTVFADSVRWIAQAIQAEFPQQTQVAMKYAYTVDIDSRTQLHLFPSVDKDLPLGLSIQTFGPDHGLDSETMVGLFSEWSFALGSMTSILRVHVTEAV